MRIYNLSFLLVFYLLSCGPNKKGDNKKKPDILKAFKGPAEFYFVRHGETNWGKGDILQGPQDLQLNANGLKQAEQAGIKLKHALSKFSLADAKIVTSTLKRAHETAQNISQILNVAISDKEDGLKEFYYGDYRLCSDKHAIPPDAESTGVFQKRVTRALNKVLEKHASAKPLIIVSHQKVFGWVSESLTKSKEELPQGGIAHFIRNHDGSWKLEILK